MIKLIVACLAEGMTRFDREYYVREHLPLTLNCWRQYSLEGAAAFFPDGSGDGWVSIGVDRFRHLADIDIALRSDETGRVMADVANPQHAQSTVRSVLSDHNQRRHGTGTKHSRNMVCSLKGARY